MQEFNVQCGGCGVAVAGMAHQPDRTRCPRCGSTSRQINLSITEEIHLKEQLGMKAKDPGLPGKRKIRIEQLVGDDLHRNSGKWLKKVRIIDRENNRYFEEVVDPDSGEVMHRCEEPLSDHYGHGSDLGPRKGA
jgi:hypothetical protein